MKKKIIVILISLMMSAVTGCVEAINLDNEQEDKFLGYVVYSVLEHDNNYMVGLNTVEPSTEPQTETVAPDSGIEEPTTSGGDKTTSGGDGNGSDSPVILSNMERALGVNNLSFKFTEYKVCDSYPEADGTPAFAMTALSGNKLVVVKFNVTNTSDGDVLLDVSSKKLSFKGIFNKSVKTAALVTLLPEALNTFSETIPAGKTVETVLVFEMREASVQNITEIMLDIKSESGTNSVQIK